MLDFLLVKMIIMIVITDSFEKGHRICFIFIYCVGSRSKYPYILIYILYYQSTNTNFHILSKFIN